MKLPKIPKDLFISFCYGCICAFIVFFLLYSHSVSNEKLFSVRDFNCFIKFVDFERPGTTQVIPIYGSKACSILLDYNQCSAMSGDIKQYVTEYGEPIVGCELFGVFVHED